ncbi:hypothetical protein PVAP13_6KG109500 [Panicum virgatum]|uniref:Uncharacterized protein n=1 Tax=Panicum virgatum TaxID=38727 RepID=A0A8T0RC40_PANVG|nr:hypothetical protein PVAP13_6KG109500 [Panicum virgatum]
MYLNRRRVFLSPRPATSTAPASGRTSTSSSSVLGSTPFPPGRIPLRVLPCALLPSPSASRVSPAGGAHGLRHRRRGPGPYRPSSGVLPTQHHPPTLPLPTLTPPPARSASTSSATTSPSPRLLAKSIPSRSRFFSFRHRRTLV